MVIKRMRWKAIFQDTKKQKANQQRYGLRSFKIPRPVKELPAFESELIELIEIPKSEKPASKSTERRHKKDKSVRQDLDLRR